MTLLEQRIALRDFTLRGAFVGERPISEVAAIARATDSEPPLIECPSALPLARLVCCFCTPHHVMRDGPEPASHGACPVAVAKLHAEMDALEARA